MYCMNLMKFETNDLSTKFIEARIGDDNEKKIKNSILQHHFNSKIILYMPDTPSLPKYIASVLTDDKSFYCVKNLAVQELCTYEFLKAFVNSGKVYGYSANTKLDDDFCAALIPSGSLFLLLDHFKYHELGISGKLSSNVLRNPKHKFFIEINTSEQCFTPGKKIYERTHKALDSCPIQFDFYINWHPHDDNICPSSIAKYFQDKGYQVEEVDPFIKQNLKHDVRIPKLCELEEEALDHDNLLEWLGMCAADIDSQILNTVAPEPMSSISSLTVAHVEGFYTPSNIEEVISSLREWLTERERESVPWLCLTVYGPPDCLISWSKTENSFKVNGENFYVLFILRDRLLYYTIEENKKPQRVHVKSSNRHK